jgi:hypothetical protein
LFVLCAALRAPLTDLILNVPIPATNGFTVLTANAGSMENRGLEFVFLNIDTKDFKWRTSINVGINRNKVLELPGASPGADGKDLLGKPIKEH